MQSCYSHSWFAVSFNTNDSSKVTACGIHFGKKKKMLQVQRKQKFYISVSLSLSLYIYNVYLGVLSLNNDLIMKRQVLERWSLTPSASALESYIHLYQLAVLHANPRMGFVSIS